MLNIKTIIPTIILGSAACPFCNIAAHGSEYAEESGIEKVNDMKAIIGILLYTLG